MSNFSSDYLAAQTAERQRAAMAEARAHRLASALRWKRRAARAALRARIVRETI